MKRLLRVWVIGAMAAAMGCDPADPSASATTASDPRVVAADGIAAGRYIVEVAGCNDCHTDGVMTGKKVSESEWLLGSKLGFRGPWGTSYASNLRLYAQPLSSDQFVQTLRSREGRPPMPWASLHAMSDRDLRAVHAYLKHLGPGGEQMPPALPPGQEPATPYIDMSVVMPGAAAGAAVH